VNFVLTPTRPLDTEVKGAADEKSNFTDRDLKEKRKSRPRQARLDALEIESQNSR
jgi:hypothetical protein